MAAGIAVVVLVARGNRLQDLEPLVPALKDVLQEILPCQLVHVGG